MPQIKGFKSLFEITLDFVAHNMDALSKLTRGDEIYFIPPDVNTPFDKLPSVILETILYALQQKDLLEKQHVELLLASHLQVLDLTGNRLKFDGDGMLDILYRAYIRCFELKILKLPNYEKFQDYVSFFPKFEKLQILVLSRTSTSDKSLELIGMSCKNLRELDITDCSCVTDEGIKALCVVSVAENSVEGKKKGQCKLIENLLTKGTRISNIGIQIAIENMPALKIFTSASIQNLAEIHEMDLKNKNFLNIPKYSLTTLQLDSSCGSSKCVCLFVRHYESGSLENVVLLYPFLMKVEVNLTVGFTNNDLLYLKFVERLCELKINGSCKKTYEDITFNEGVKPLLKAIGPSLRTLELKDLKTIRIDIGILTKLCPNLYSLALYRNRIYTTSKPEETADSFQTKKLNMENPILKKLSVLQLHCRGDKSEAGFLSLVSSSIPEENLVSLLSLPSLIDIQIANCCSLTDVVLHQVAKYNHFPKLEVLKLTDCNYVSINAILVFMKDSNPLHTVSLLDCSLLTREVKEEFKRLVVEKNWMLTLS